MPSFIEIRPVSREILRHVNGQLDGGPTNILPPRVLLAETSNVLATCGVFSYGVDSVMLNLE